MYWIQKTTLILIVFFLMPACSQQNSHKEMELKFSGNWIGSAQQSGSANPTFTLDIKNADGKLSGVINSMDKTFTNVNITDTRVGSESLLFRAVANGGTQYKDHLFAFNAYRQGDTLQGTWTDILEGSQGSFSLKLRPKE